MQGCCAFYVGAGGDVILDFVLQGFFTFFAGGDVYAKFTAQSLSIWLSTLYICNLYKYLCFAWYLRNERSYFNCNILATCKVWLYEGEILCKPIKCAHFTGWNGRIDMHQGDKSQATGNNAKPLGNTDYQPETRARGGHFGGGIWATGGKMREEKWVGKTVTDGGKRNREVRLYNPAYWGVRKDLSRVVGRV